VLTRLAEAAAAGGAFALAMAAGKEAVHVYRTRGERTKLMATLNRLMQVDPSDFDVRTELEDLRGPAAAQAQAIAAGIQERLNVLPDAVREKMQAPKSPLREAKVGDPPPLAGPARPSEGLAPVRPPSTFSRPTRQDILKGEGAALSPTEVKEGVLNADLTQLDSGGTNLTGMFFVGGLISMILGATFSMIPAVIILILISGLKRDENVEYNSGLAFVSQFMCIMGILLGFATG